MKQLEQSLASLQAIFDEEDAQWKRGSHHTPPTQITEALYKAFVLTNKVLERDAERLRLGRGIPLITSLTVRLCKVYDATTKWAADSSARGNCHIQ